MATCCSTYKIASQDIPSLAAAMCVVESDTQPWNEDLLGRKALQCNTGLVSSPFTICRHQIQTKIQYFSHRLLSLKTHLNHELQRKGTCHPSCRRRRL